MIATGVDPVRASTAGTFDRLAGTGALGFLIDMLVISRRWPSRCSPSTRPVASAPDHGRSEAKPAHVAEPEIAPVLLVSRA
jgi:hypothetical protein